MIEKLKSHYNKKYTTISVYVISTILIIFLLAYIAIRINDILNYTGNILAYAFGLLTPVIIGIIIAYILDPLVERLERLLKKIKFLNLKKEKKYRSLAVFLCITLILLIIFLLIGVFIFSITKQISSIRFDDFSNILVNYINNFSNSLKGLEDRLGNFNVESGTINQYVTRFSSMMISSLSNFVDNLTGNILNLTVYISNILFGLIVAIYLLLEKTVFIGYINMIFRAIFSERIENRLKGYWRDFDRIFSGYIRGQLLDALFMSVVLSVSLSIIGIKFGALIGILAGLCNLVPYIGPVVAFAGTVFFGVLNAQYSKVLIAIIVLVIVQQIDGNIIAPKFMSEGVALKPVFILVAVIIGSQIGGVIGMLLAVPVAALLKLFVKRFIEGRLRSKETLRENEK